MPVLMALTRGSLHRFIVFCDDLSFDAEDTTYKSLKAVLEGGIEGRPDNVIFYATSNRRHLMSRDMMENERSTAINPGETVEEKVSLSDRFGLWLGFHRCSQDEYLAMVDGYVTYYKIPAQRRSATPRRARMVDHARFPLRSRGMAIRAGFGRTARGRAERLGTAEVLGRVDRCRTFPDLEMQLRRGYVAGLPRVRDHLPALDRVAALDHQLARMGVRRHEPVRVTDQHQVAVAFELIAGVSNHAIIGRFDWRAFWYRKIDPVILGTVWFAAESRNDPAANWPTERRHRAARFRGLDYSFGRAWFFLRNVHSLSLRARNFYCWRRAAIARLGGAGVGPAASTGCPPAGMVSRSPMLSFAVDWR